MRVVVLVALVLAIAGLRIGGFPFEGMNVFFVLDRSDSVPSSQQETARGYVNVTAKQMQKVPIKPG